MAQKSVVSLVKGTDIQAMVDKALDLLDGVDSLIKPGSTVVIKPNVGHPSPPESSVCTNPEVVRAAIRSIKRYKPKEIICMEAAAVGQDTLKAFEVSGIGKVCEEEGVKIIDFKRLTKDELIDYKVPGAKAIDTFAVAKFMKEADCIVALPIFKTHLSMVMTGAVKGQKGCVDDKMHRRMHFVDLSEALIDLLAAVKPHLAIVDMIRPMEGLGPMAAGTPVDFGAILASTDMIAVDATCCRLIGIEPEKTYLVKGVERGGLGVLDEDLIEVRGNTINECFKKLDTSYLEGFARYPEYNIYDENACSSCSGVMVYVLEQLKKQGKYDENKGISIVFGAKKELPEGCARGKDLVLMGNCVKKFRDQGVFVGGCPPVAFGPIFGIIKREDQEEEQCPVDTWKNA